MHDGAYRGMVCGSEAHSQREWAGTFAVVGVIPTGRDDPPGPADLIKVNEKGNTLAGLRAGLRRETGGSTSPSAALVAGLRCCSRLRSSYKLEYHYE